MWIAAFLCIIVGISIVAQNGVNAQLSKQTSLWLLLTIGNLVAAAGSFSLFLWSTRERLEMSQAFSRVPLAVLIPAVAGFVITSAMPTAITRIGVFGAVMLVIASQIVASLVWDGVASGQAITPLRVVGAVLVAGGAALALRG